MKHLNPLVLLLSILLSILLSVSGCEKRAPAIQPNGESILVGVIGELNSFKGRSAIGGMERVLELHSLLDDGTAIELRLENAADEADAASAALQRLAASKEIVAVVSLFGSETTLAMAPLANQLAIPVLAATATNPDIVEGGPWISQLMYDDSFQGAVAAVFVGDELRVERVAVVSDPENTYSRYLAEQFTSKFEAEGGELTRQIHLTGSAADDSGELAGARGDHTELIYMTVGAEQLLAIGKVLEAMDWKPRLMGPDGSLSSLQSRFPGQLYLFEGMLATDVYSPSMPLSQVGKEHRVLPAGVLRQLDTFSVLGIEALAVLKSAMIRCDQRATDRACLGAAIRDTRDLPGILGRITITQDGRAIRPLVINTIKKGNIVYRVRVY
jgi:branched-chain amino acid transport system substrate-binding protein